MDIISSQKLGNILRISFAFLFPLMLFVGTIYILLSLVSSQPLGHDESVYLTKARSWMQGTPADQFSIYRPIGMVVSGWVILHFSESEQVIRYFGVYFGSLVVLFIYLLFKRIANMWVAICVSLVVLSSTIFLRESPQFFNDVPSAGLLIGMIWLIYICIEKLGASKLIYLVPLFGASSFYLRYGSIIPIVAILVATLLFFSTTFLRSSKDFLSKHTIRAFILMVLLFVPHFIYSQIKMNNIFGILSLSGKSAGRKYVGEGLLSYVQWLPHELGGWVLGVTAVIGIVITVVLLLDKRVRTTYVSLVWLGSVGVLSFILVGLLVHPEARYTFFSVVLLSGVGISGIYFFAKVYSTSLAKFLMIAFGFTAILLGVSNYYSVDAFYREREVNPYSNALGEVLRVVRNDLVTQNADKCVIWSAVFRPTISWYSQCNVFAVSDVGRFESDFKKYPNAIHYSLSLVTLQENQINLETAEKYGIVLTEVYRTRNLGKFYRGDFVVYRIEKKEFLTDDPYITNDQEYPEREWIEL